MGRLLKGMSASEMVATLEVFDQHGVTPEIFAKIRRERDNFGKRVSMFMINDGAGNGLATIGRAREIMGRNFLGTEAVIRHFEIISMTDEIVKAFSVIPFTEVVLAAAKNDHILVADFGISLLNVRSRVKSGLFRNQDFYNSFHWAKRSEAPQWRLIRRSVVYKSSSRPWDEQALLLQTDEVIPSVRQMAYVIMLNYLENNERLFAHTWARTSDEGSGGDYIGLGCFDDKDGLAINHWYSAAEKSRIGLASAKIPTAVRQA